LNWLDYIIDIAGITLIVFMVSIVVYILYTYIRKIIKRQTKIKCLCHHEYKPHCAFCTVEGMKYEFKCRKCGKIISIQTVTTDDLFVNGHL
jgi:tRNA(Ile2) C34 agmatinyltransferase TiaS